jgi:predicted transposase YbfD/YdcC
MLLGMVVACETLREVEELADDIALRRVLGLRGSPSDTMMDTVLRRLTGEALALVLVAQIRRMWRSKQLEVVEPLGISLVAIDGKAIATDRSQTHPESQRQRHKDRADTYILRVLRAVHTASVVKPVVGQMVIPAARGEETTLRPFVEQLVRDYGRSGMLECFTMDAGFCTRSDMEWMNSEHLGFIVGLKGDQPTLYAEAKRWLGEGDRSPAGGWSCEVEEVSGSRQVTRWFARTDRLLNFHNWTCIRQTWRVRQRTVKGGKVTWGDRYYITNLPKGRLKRRQCLAAVRAHWGIENDANWTYDAIWKEDQRAWVRQGWALESLAMLRILAINEVRLLRHRVLRTDRGEPMPYRTLLRLIRQALTAPDELAIAAAGFG